METPNFLYSMYERNLQRQIREDRLPRHVGIILDGNRRWARALGASTATGHRRGAGKISEVLGWCEEVGIELVTLWLLSTDNLNRAKDELNDLLDIIVSTVERLARARRWNIRLLGDLDLLPAKMSTRLREAAERTKNVSGLRVNIAIGYGGRQEITRAVRAYLEEQAAQGASLQEVADSVSIAAITDHMYTKGQPDPDLIIRTSGEQRMSGFLLWQTVHTEFYFCETNWPDFRRVDFLRALRDFTSRERRLGR